MARLTAPRGLAGVDFGPKHRCGPRPYQKRHDGLVFEAGTMSGRVRVTLADGRRVTGFRKTLRRNPRSAHRPELRFTFLLPPRLAFATRAGVYGFATVDPDGMVTVRGRDRDFVLRKAGEFLRSIAHGLTLDPISGALFCPSRPAPTSGAPDRPGYQDRYQIMVSCGTPSVTIACTGLKPMVLA